MSNVIDLENWRRHAQWTARYRLACQLLGVAPASSPTRVPARDAAWHALAYEIAYACESPSRERDEFRAFLIGVVLARETLSARRA